MRTLLHTWTQRCVNTEHFSSTAYWGLGDTIRNTLFLYQYCKRKNYRLIVDISLHPVSEIWQNQPHEYQELVQSMKNKIPFVTRGTLDQFLKEHTEDVVVLFPAGWPNEKLLPDEVEFISQIMKPRPEYEAQWSSWLAMQGLNKNYTVLHFRFLDEVLYRGVQEKELALLRPVFNRWVNKADLLISDSLPFKKQMHQESGIKFFELNVSRFGKSETGAELEGTLFEFFLLKNAARILTYSPYPWVSSFVYWSHIIYGTPLKIIGDNRLKARFIRWGFRQMVAFFRLKERWF